jgi:ribosomal protein S18 acetylase RimI-like enzyme
MNGIRFSRDETNVDHLVRHLRACDRAFMPPLSERLDIGDYAVKLAANATRFEAWLGDELTGLVAAYCNSADKGTAFITSVSVLVQQQGKGIAANLLEHCIVYVRNIGFIRMELEVDNRNETAMALYKRFGFVSTRTTDNLTKITMTMDLEKEAR